MKSNWYWNTNVTITVRNPDGSVKEMVKLHNKIPVVARNMVRDFLHGTETDGKIRELALGDDSTPPTDGDTALGNEVFRKAITGQTDTGDGELTTITYVNAGEAVGEDIQEIGWFNNIGLVSRVLWAHGVKTGLESFDIERVDTISEVP